MYINKQAIIPGLIHNNIYVPCPPADRGAARRSADLFV